MMIFLGIYFAGLVSGILLLTVFIHAMRLHHRRRKAKARIAADKKRRKQNIIYFPGRTQHQSALTKSK